MEIMLPIVVFLFGTIIGSFLNVVILRHNTGKTINGRSRCMSCNRQLTWTELVPIFSFLIQGGACKKCKSKISRQYPLVEFLTGAIFVLIFISFPVYSAIDLIWLGFYLVISCILMVISVYDIKHKIIPDKFVYSFIALSLVGLFMGEESLFILPSLGQLVSGPLLALPFALIWFFSKGSWMGFGDAKLALGIGWILGFNAGANSMVLAFWIAAIASISWILIRYHSIKPKTEVPFGPYLIIGMYVVLLFRVEVIDFAFLGNLVLSLFGR